jgi:hypothetical protein
VLLIVREEEVVGADSETHEMDILEPHTSNVANSLRLASTSQDINDEAQPEGVNLYLPLLSHPETIIFFCYRIRGKRHP